LEKSIKQEYFQHKQIVDQGKDQRYRSALIASTLFFNAFLDHLALINQITAPNVMA